MPAQGTAHTWLFVPTAILLGALYGLEPGHSETMTAPFIIAVRGTVTQAVLLGLAAILSHTAVVWPVALAGQPSDAEPARSGAGSCLDAGRIPARPRAGDLLKRELTS